MAVPELPAQYLEGIRLFNEEEFFECHEVLEELWSEMQGPERKFVQGLIQAAIALFHFGNENFGGAKKLYQSSTKLLNEHAMASLGLDLPQFLADFETCFRELLENQEAYPTTVALRDELVPKLRLLESE